VRQNAHQPLRELGPMAFAVLRAVASRLHREGRLREPLPTSFIAGTGSGLELLDGAAPERPPHARLRAVA
jgi:hypothetical protein